MSTIDLIKEVIPEPSQKINIIAETLDKKTDIRNLWKSQAGKSLLKILQDDSLACLNSLISFENLSLYDIRGILSKYRSNTILLASLKWTSNIDEIQDMLDSAVKEEAQRR